MKKLNITMKILIISSIFIALLFAGAQADSLPTTINYQGYLTDDSNEPVNDTVGMEFKFYEVSTGGTATYAENHPNVSINKGLYSVELGSGTASTGNWSTDPDFSKALWLEIIINGTDTLSPRIPLRPSPYTRMALDVSDGVVTASKLDGNPGDGTSGQLLTSDGNGGFSWKSTISATLTGNATGISSSDQATVLSSKNSANSIYIHSNGGTSETIKIHSDQGEDDSSIEITSDGGGVAVNAASGKSISLNNDQNKIAGIDGKGIALDGGKAFYFGDSNSSSDGDWRIIRNGDNLDFQRFDGSNWVPKLSISD